MPSAANASRNLHSLLTCCERVLCSATTWNLSRMVSALWRISSPARLSGLRFEEEPKEDRDRHQVPQQRPERKAVLARVGHAEQRGEPGDDRPEDRLAEQEPVPDAGRRCEPVHPSQPGDVEKQRPSDLYAARTTWPRFGESGDVAWADTDFVQDAPVLELGVRPITKSAEPSVGLRLASLCDSGLFLPLYGVITRWRVWS